MESDGDEIIIQKLQERIANDLLDGKPCQEIIESMVAGGCPQEFSLALVTHVDALMRDYKKRARQEMIERELPFFLGTTVAVYLGCWGFSILLGTLPDSSGKAGEKLGGHLLGGTVSFFSKDLGHVGIYWGGLMGWLIYFIHFIATF